MEFRHRLTAPSGIITYSFVPYFVSEQEYYEWVDWEKDYIASALSKIEAVIDVQFVKKIIFQNLILIMKTWLWYHIGRIVRH